MDTNEQRREREMRAAFLEQAQHVIVSHDRFDKAGERVRMGLESEVAIYREDLMMSDIERTRDAIIRDVREITDVELGAAQIELRTPPTDVSTRHGFEEHARIYRERAELLVRAARARGCSILRVGANPFLPIHRTPRTQRPKYQLVPDYYNRHRPRQADTIIGLGREKVDIGDAAIVSLFQSFQVNLEARSLCDACDKMNRSFFIAPYLLAISGNARFLEFVDTRFHDMRMVAWKKSHDTRMNDVRMVSWEKSFDLRSPEEIVRGCALRVGLPERYFVDIADYFKRMERFPFILYQPEAALQIAVGMTWLDVRVKLIGDSAVVELRLLPTQPTVEEELCAALLYIGRLVDSQHRNEPLLPIEYVRENRHSAMCYGPHRKMWFIANDGTVKRLPYRVGMQQEIQRAITGLSYFGLSELLDMDLLRGKLARGSPSDELGRVVYRDGQKFSRTKMVHALQETRMLI